MGYIKIPNDLIYNKNLGKKRALVYSAIYFAYESNFTIDELVNFCDYTTARCGEQISLLVNQFKENEYLEVLSKNGIYYCRPIQLESNFGIILEHEFKTILSYRKEKKKENKRINHADLILLLAYIRGNMELRDDKPEMHYTMMGDIPGQLGLSLNSIRNGLKILEGLHIIHSEELPRNLDINNLWHANYHVFLNYHTLKNSPFYDWREEFVKVKNEIKRLKT